MSVVNVYQMVYALLSRFVSRVRWRFDCISSGSLAFLLHRLSFIFTKNYTLDV